MTTISLKEFLKTGMLGNIQIGKSTKQDVINLFGEDYDFADCGYDQIISYGWYEFFYHTDSELVFGFQNDHLSADCYNTDDISYQNNQVKIDTWFIKPLKVITVSEVESHLKQLAIHFTLQENTYDKSPEFKLENGISIDFIKAVPYQSKQTEEVYMLNGIRLFNFN